MALTYTATDFSTVSDVALVSSSITYTTGQPIVVMAGAPLSSYDATISDTSGLTWNLLSTQTSTSAKGFIWYALPTSGGSTLVTIDNSNSSVHGYRVITFTGAGTPIVVGGAVPGAVSTATLMSQLVNPTSAGSALFMWITEGGAQTALPATPGTGCTQESNSWNSFYNANWVVRPTTNPLTSNAAFTLATTTDGTTQDLAWIAIEVPAAGSSAATATTLTGPTAGTAGTASSNFTVGANGTITGTVIVTPNDGGLGGRFVPTTISISSGTPTGTFTYTAPKGGTRSISTTNNGSLSNPTSISFNAAPGGGSGSSSTIKFNFSAVSNPTAANEQWTGISGYGIKDIVTGDLVFWSYGSAFGATPQALYSSQDNGATWARVATDATTPLTGNDHIRAAVQDSTGSVHCLTYDYSGNGVGYGRFILTRASGHVTGYTWVVTPFALPMHGTGANESRCNIYNFKLGGVETIVYEFSANTGGTNLQAFAGRATSLTPSSSANFVGLDGTGSDSILLNVTEASGSRNSHTHQTALAQIGSTEDLYFFCGPFDNDQAAPPQGTISNDDLWYRQLPKSSGNWVVGSSSSLGTNIVPAASGVTIPSLIAVGGNSSRAWVQYSSGTAGVNFGYINSSNTLTAVGVTSPLDTPDRLGFGTFTVSDANEIWTIFNTFGGFGSTTPTGKLAYWNGTAWEINATDATAENCIAIISFTGWAKGCAAVRIPGDVTSQVATGLLSGAAIYTPANTGISMGVYSPIVASNFATSLTTTGINTQNGSTFIVPYNGAAGIITGITDNKGNTYTLKATNNYNGAFQSLYVYVCENGIGGTGHTVTVTTGSFVSYSISLIEITGKAIWDTSANSTGNSATINTASITTSAADVVIAICGGPSYTTYSSVVDSFGNVVSSVLAGATYGTESAIGIYSQSAAGTISDTFTWSAAVGYGTIIAGFKPKPLYPTLSAPVLINITTTTATPRVTIGF